MRYLLVNYYQKPTGQMDEVISVAKRTRPKDLQTCSVILDFEKQSVVKCSMGSEIGVRDFGVIRNYFHKHYSKLIENLEIDNGKKESHTG